MSKSQKPTKTYPKIGESLSKFQLSLIVGKKIQTTYKNQASSYLSRRASKGKGFRNKLFLRAVGSGFSVLSRENGQGQFVLGNFDGKIKVYKFGKFAELSTVATPIEPILVFTPKYS